MTNPETTARGQDTSGSEVRCLLLPLNQGAVLLPNTAVAEVTSEVHLQEPPPAGVEWLQGWTRWRGLQVPVLALEPLFGSTAPTAGAQRIAVLNTLNGNPALPFVAVAIRAIPRPVQVSEGVLGACRGETAAGVHCRLELAGGEAIIPDLDVLEQWSLAAGVPRGSVDDGVGGTDGGEG